MKIVASNQLPPRSWFGLITLSETGMHLWTIPIEVTYYFFIPVICILFKLASQVPFLKGLFLTTLSLLCYVGCNYNIIGMTKELYEANNRSRVIFTCFRLTIFVFLTGSLIGFLLHSIRNSAFLNNVLKWKSIQLILSILSIVQFCRAYACTMWPQGEPFMNFIHMPGFQWALFLLLLLLNSAKWNMFVFFFENDRNLQMLGKYSFGMYLNHHIGIYMISKTKSGASYINDRFGVPEKLVMIVCFLYPVGWLWYILLEKPMIVWANKACGRIESFQASTKIQIQSETINYEKINQC